MSLPRLAIERCCQMIRLYRNWPIALLDRAGLLPAGTYVHTVRSSVGTARLVARANGCDIRTITEIWIGELYDRFVDRDWFAGRRPVIVDIGANCGYFAVYAGLRFPQARLVCFEPEPENHSLAETNLALNGLHAELRREAVVGNDAPTVMLNLADDPRLHTTVARRDAGAHGLGEDRYTARAVEVPAVNVNDALRPLAEQGEIDLVKIDVEGLDLDLVNAIDDDVLSAINCLVAETECRDTAGTVAHLTSRGFQVVEDVSLLLATRRAAAVGSHGA